MMTKILVYGYCVGVFSLRGMQKRLQEDVAFRVLAADNHPDFRTLSDFCRIHLSSLKGAVRTGVTDGAGVGALSWGGSPSTAAS
jgi:hypothetical protein